MTHAHGGNGTHQFASEAGRAPGAIPPGATLGVLGGGQLGRYFVHSAQRLGFRVVVLDPDADAPAGRAADRHICAPFDDPAALAAFSEATQAVTVEFENVPHRALSQLARHCPTRPGALALQVTQSRIDEKCFIARLGLPVVPYGIVRTADELTHAWRVVGPGRAILKRATEGYDGRGQVRVASEAELVGAFDVLGRAPSVLERQIDLAREISVILARHPDGSSVCFPVLDNVHANGILYSSQLPAEIDPALSRQAVALTTRIAVALDYVGVLAVELFVDHDGAVFVNEIAPRPHNSGHVSLDACSVSQFDLQVRCVCGLPLVTPVLRAPAAMVNLLGDLWQPGAPAFESVLGDPQAYLHLYGKREPRPGRKMGHLTVLDGDPAKALARCMSLRAQVVSAR